MKTRVLPLVMVVGILAGIAENCWSAIEAKVEPGDAPGQVNAATLQPVKDPIEVAVSEAKHKSRQAYDDRRFDDLEAEATRLRDGKEKFENGSWKIAQFYDAFDCRRNDPESVWQQHDQIHQEWIAAKPQSITARVAYAGFLTDYAWKARGGGYADTVSEDGWRLFGERLAAARKVLEQAGALAEKDPCWWMKAMTVALGQGWSPEQYKELLDDVHAFEPTFWGCDMSRAYSLLPRWYGEPGDWEAFAAETASRPEGLGIELYARVVIRLHGFYKNVFSETNASWPKTHEGLEVLLKKYPTSLTLLSQAALLATMAGDQATAQIWFERIGTQYLPSVWNKPERFLQLRQWAETGK